MNPQSIECRDPADLKPHPLLRDLPAWANDDPRFLALCDDVQEHGILEPILITGAGLVVDGRHRHRAAKRMQLPEIPCILVPDDQVAEIALATCIHRRHMTAGQIAFVMEPIIRAAYEESQARKAQNLKKGQCFPETNLRSLRGEKGLEYWAGTLGICRRLLTEARKIREYFEDYEEKVWTWGDAEKAGLAPDKKHNLRAYFTPLIFEPDRPMGLGAVLAGIQQKFSQEERAAIGHPHKGGRPKESSRQLELFAEAWGQVEHRYQYWQKFTPEAKRTALDTVGRSLQEMPEDLLHGLQARVKAELKRRPQS